MPKRKYDKRKHSKENFELGKDGSKTAKGGWGNPLDGMSADFERKDPKTLKHETVSLAEEKLAIAEASLAKVAQNPVQLWSSQEVSEWIESFGTAYQDTAAMFRDLSIAGETLLSLEYDDLEATLGKGLKTRKLWGEIEKLRETAVEESKMVIDPSIPQWRFFNSKSGWIKFPPRENAEIEGAYRESKEVKIRGWTLRLTASQPHATYENFTRMLSREGGFGKAFSKMPAEANINVRPGERTWARIADPNASLTKQEIESTMPMSPRVANPRMKTFSARRTFLAMEPCEVYRTSACLDSEIVGKIHRFHLVNFVDIGMGGIAEISQPMNGYVPMVKDDVTRQCFARVFIIRGVVYESEKKKSFKSMGEGLRAVQTMYKKFRVQVFDAAGMIIGKFGTTDLNEALPVILEEIDGVVSMHFVKKIEVDTWNEFPELIVKRSTANIAWNLWKKDALSHGLQAGDVADVQQLFRTKKNKGKFSVPKPEIWKNMPCVQSFKEQAPDVARSREAPVQGRKNKRDYEARLKAWFQGEVHILGRDQMLQLPSSMNSYTRRMVHGLAEELGYGHESLGKEPNRHLYIFKGKSRKVKANITIDRQEYVKRAQQLKRSSEEFVKNNVLNYLDQPARFKTVGLLGPVGANIGRNPTEVSMDRLRNVVSSFKNLNTRPDASYRIHRQFLRYAETLTKVLGEILDDMFDPDVVDCILMFFDDGSGDYIKNAKGSLAYESTGSKCLDFYSSYESTKSVMYVKDNEPIMTDHKISSGYLDQCWAEHPLTCLRLIFHLGAAREGKQDLHGFYVCMHWLYENHPYTLLANLHLLPDVNYFKGMLEVLDRIVEDDEAARKERNQWYKDTSKKYKSVKGACGDAEKEAAFQSQFLKGKQCYAKTEMEFATDLLKKYDSDLVFRALHRKVAQTFGKNILADSKKKHNLTLACKWCPTEGAKHDKHLLMHEAVARECFPPTGNQTEFAYQRSLRNRLRKELVSPLRLRTRVTERLISTKKLNLINYEHVSGASMRKNQSAFERLDPDGFGKYLQDVADGKAKVKSGSVSPVELYMKVRDLCRRGVSDATEFALLNGQWATMIEKLKKKIPVDQLNIVAAIDTSGSMSCQTSEPDQQCLDVAKAMGLICLGIAEGSYAGHTMVYTTHCKTIKIDGTTLKEQYESLERQTFSGGTNYTCILEEVQKNATSGSFGFPNRVIILSDMEFERGHHCSLETAVNVFESSRKQVALSKGISLDEVVNPEIVFWNIAATSKPARKTDIGCSMISGHSPQVFVDVLANAWQDMKRDVVTGQKQNDPLTVMLCALSKPLYRQLRAVTSEEEALDLLTSILKEDEVVEEKMEIEEDDLMDKEIDDETLI